MPCRVCLVNKTEEEFYRTKSGKRNTRCIMCTRIYNKNRMLEINFGITLEQYNGLLKSQGGVCAICKKPETYVTKFGDIKQLAVDHDHTHCPVTRGCGNCIRGLLCHRCNVAIGYFQDDVDLLKNAINYLL